METNKTPTKKKARRAAPIPPSHKTSTPARISKKAKDRIRMEQVEWLKKGIRISETTALDLLLFGSGGKAAAS